MRKFFHPLLAALPGPALAQSAPLQGAGTSLLQVALGLGVVIAAVIGGLWLLKRLSATHGAIAGSLRVIAGASVGPRERVVLVEVEDTWLLVGVAPGQVNALHHMPKGTLSASASGQAHPDFGARLKHILERRHAR